MTGLGAGRATPGAEAERRRRVDLGPSWPRERRSAPTGASDYPWRARLAPSVGERVGAQLEMEGDRNGALPPTFSHGLIAARRPHPAPLPSRIGVVDAAVQALGIEA